MRFIDADRFEKWLEIKFSEGLINLKTAEDIASVLKYAPTEDVKPVVRGKWYRHKKEIHGDTCFYCNVCENMAFTDGFVWDLTDFCPHCGADLRERCN